MIASQALVGTIVEDGTYKVENKLLTNNGKTYSIEVTGNYPTGGNVTILNGEIVTDQTTWLRIGDYIAIYDSEHTLSVILPICKLVSGEAYAVGAKYTCNPGDGERTFYVLENNESSSNISLILDRNIDDEIMTWCLEGTYNACGGDGAKAYLASKTNDWTNGQIISIDLPTYDQLYNVNNSGALTSTKWLWGNLDHDENTSTAEGYWTATKYPWHVEQAWYVSSWGYITNSGNSSGIRPVIIIEKAGI